MTDLRETVRGIVARACRNFRPAPDCDLEAEIVSAATDAIMSEIAKARVGTWRTMESAPRDGTPVLVYAEDMYGTNDPDGPRSRIVVSWYDESGWAWLTTHYPPKFWQPLPASPGMGVVEIVSEPTTTHLRETIEQTCAELRHQAEKARQHEGDYDILITRAELLEKALKDTEGALVVKELGWNKTGLAMWSAQTPFGTYHIVQNRDDRFAAFGPDNSALNPEATLEVAKAACQADFAKRIASAVMYTETPPELTQAGERQPEATQDAVEPSCVVTDAILAVAWEAFVGASEDWRDGTVRRRNAQDRAAIKSALTAALPHAKTEAEVRSEVIEELAREAERDGLTYFRPLHEQGEDPIWDGPNGAADWLRSRARSLTNGGA